MWKIDNGILLKAHSVIVPDCNKPFISMYLHSHWSQPLSDWNATIITLPLWENK